MKNKSPSYLLVLVFLLCLLHRPAVVLGEQEKIYTLEDSIEEAFSDNWALKAKMEKIDQASYVHSQARAEFLPKLSTTYGYTLLSKNARSMKTKIPVPGLGDEPIEIRSKNNYQWRGTVKQPVFTGFALLSSYELARLGLDQSEMEVQLEKLDLALNVKIAYFSILQADKALEVTDKAAEALESHAQVARNFYEVGMIPVNDLLESEVELGNAKHDLVKAKNASRLARCAFNTVLARPVNAPVELEDILVHTPVRGDFDDYLRKAFENRPEMRLLDINILKSDQEVRLAKSKYYPEVAIQYDYIKEGDTPDVSGGEFQWADRWEAMAVCSWTFWEWGKTHYTVQEKISLKKELTKIRTDLEYRIKLEVSEALLDLGAAEKNIPTTKKAVEQGEENLRVSEERYRAQVSTSTEVLDGQRYLTRARRNYYNALYEHHLARARLLRAIGEY